MGPGSWVRGPGASGLDPDGGRRGRAAGRPADSTKDITENAQVPQQSRTPGTVREVHVTPPNTADPIGR
jgi:hypothetical protein